MKLKKHFPFHPILLSIYSVLTLIAFNLGEFDLADGWRPLLFSLVVGVILWLFLRLVIWDWEKSAIIASMSLMLFFGYGHLYNLLKKVSIGDQVIGRHRYVFPFLAVLFLFSAFWVLRRLRHTEKITNVLNWISLALMIYPVFQILSFQITVLINEGREQGIVELDIDVDPETVGDLNKPDVYFIVLDAYARQDTLQTLYGFDNREFIQDLEGLGFYVAECSRSNYPETYLSLITSLNLNYEDLSWNLRKMKSRWRLTTFFEDNAVRNFFENQGYITVAVQSGVFWTEWTRADIYLAVEGSSGSRLTNLSKLELVNDFESQFIDTTLVKMLNDYEILFNPYWTWESGYQRKRARVLFALDQLDDIPNIPGPKFVISHIGSPHRPFIFGPDGEEYTGPDGKITAEEDFLTGYTNQVTFLNKRLIPILDSIIQKSEIPPVIIMIGDHGPGFTEPEYRATTLGAFYLPDGGEQDLYPSITPVNIFRVVLNYYFGADFELLEDVHYHGLLEDDPEDYFVVPNVGPVCGEDN